MCISGIHVRAMSAVILYLLTLLSTSIVLAKQKTCSPYPHVQLDHGTIRRVGYQKYAFKCDEGYYLASRSPIKCFHGNWTDLREPKCLGIQGQCDDPPAVEHGRVYGDERHQGARVKYICDEGFTLLGHSELICSESGHWNQLKPTCMAEKEPLENVAERLGDSFVNELASYSVDTPQGRLLDKASLRLGLELYLLIDRSSSVDPVHLEDAKNFVKFLLRKFAVRNGLNNINGTRAGLLAFGTNVQNVFSVDDANITDFQAAAVAVDTIQPNGGGTNIEGALTTVLLESRKLREKAKRALFLMTDGEPNIANPNITAQDIAFQLKKHFHFEIFTVGIGKGINRQLLKELASEPPLSHVFILEDYPDLNDVMKIIEDSKPPPPPISREQCGYNGTMEGQPWLATLYIGGGPFKVCEGVLICSQWVLTTATCLQEGHDHVDKQDVFVVLGERNLLRGERGQTNFYVVDMRAHLNYDPKDRIRNNLALVKLNLPAARYRPACLPPTDRAVPLHLNLNINASIAGWGRSTASGATFARANDLDFEMHTTSVSLSEEQECPVRTRGLSLLCAGQGTRTCYGLVGSPLMAVDSSTGFQHVLGVLADRRYCARDGQNQYVELTKYIGWINHVTSKCQLKHWGFS